MALAVGCTQDDGISEFQPDTNKTGNVTLLASIENADSRASLVATGEARWQANDAIKVVCNDGSTAVFNIDGTGETRRALFTGTLEGKSVGEYALYPTSAELSGETLSVELPAQITPSPTGSCSFMVGVIDEKNEVTFKQLTAYANVQINKLAPETGSIVFSSDKNLSGLHSVTLPDGMTTGTAATDGDATVTISFAEAAPTMVNAFFALPIGNYSHITATAYNKDGKKISEVVLGSLIAVSRGLLLDYQIELAPMKAEKPAPIAGTVNVAGIYWALGNLQYEKGGATGNGFVAGWSIAPSQESHPNAGATGTVTKSDYNIVAHFNFGGIADYASINAASAVNVAATPALDFSGKMFTDAACTSATTDFATAKYGDIAHWASMGQYRMPSAEDFANLYAKANYTVATYNGITGIYFFDPGYGEDPMFIEGIKELAAADLTEGLFLPCTGRGYNNTEYNIYKVDTQAFYRTSTVDSNSQEGNGYGLIYRVYADGTIENAPFFNDGLRASGNNAGTYNYGAMARFSIRPVYVKGGSAVTPPTPGPEPEPEPEPGPDTDPVPTTGTVTVAGVEWAIGNLQYENGGTTTDGFATGWGIGAGQHYHLHLGASGDKDDMTDFSRMAHFNFGGITDPFINDVASCASIAGTKSISGKMYTDQTCINETTDFAAAKFGDIAYWASNGKYRMPTAEEMQKLYTDACRIKATYITADGVTVAGTYYYDPAAGETAGVVEGEKVVRNADMTKGLFLPYTGRYQSGNTYKLFAITTQAVYRSATTISASTLESTYGAIYRPHTLTESETKCDATYIYTYYEAKNQNAYGVLGRYAIRPVKVK